MWILGLKGLIETSFTVIYSIILVMNFNPSFSNGQFPSTKMVIILHNSKEIIRVQTWFNQSGFSVLNHMCIKPG